MGREVESSPIVESCGFFRTGHTINNSLALSIGNEYNQTRVSAVTMNGAGIIPNNDVDRYNFSLRNTSSLLRNRLKLDINLRYIHTAEQNMQSQGMYDNPLVPVYLLPDVLLERIPVYPGSSDKYSYKDLLRFTFRSWMAMYNIGLWEKWDWVCRTPIGQ